MVLLSAEKRKLNFSMLFGRRSLKGNRGPSAVATGLSRWFRFCDAWNTNAEPTDKS